VTGLDALTFLIAASIDEYRKMRGEVTVADAINALRSVEARLLRLAEDVDKKPN